MACGKAWEFFSPCRSVGAQRRPAGVGVLHHRAAAPAARVCLQAWEFFITVLRRPRPESACRRGSSSSPCCGARGQGLPAGVGVLHHRAAALAARVCRQAWEFFSPCCGAGGPDLPAGVGVLLTVPRRRCPAPAGRRGSSSSPCCGAGGQGLPAGVGVLHHRAAASVPSAGLQAWEFFITVPGVCWRRRS